MNVWLIIILHLCANFFSPRLSQRANGSFKFFKLWKVLYLKCSWYWGCMCTKISGIRGSSVNIVPLWARKFATRQKMDVLISYGFWQVVIKWFTRSGTHSFSNRRLSSGHRSSSHGLDWIPRSVKHIRSWGLFQLVRARALLPRINRNDPRIICIISHNCL